MPVFHIIAIGPPGSGKSQVIRHFYNNLPEGYRLNTINTIQEAFGQEYWIIKVEKLRIRKARKHAIPR